MDVTDDSSHTGLDLTYDVPPSVPVPEIKTDQTPTPSLEPPLRDSAPSSNFILGSPSKMRPSSVIATKNTRKRMEDRHVVLHDLKAYLPSALQAKIDSEEHVSYYAVFDGHAGTDAAAFAAAHLHEMLIDSPAYPANPVAAFSEAFIKCDSDFIQKSKKSGSTAICSLLKGNIIFTAWLGDSQAVLVRNGVPVKIVEAHKPNRDDERARIEALGGSIMHWGTWRVNGQLAVSRAIGDGDYKPYISAEPDITTIIKNGTEDFLIIGCDGLWDTITPEEATEIVFQHLEENKISGGQIENIGARLATAAKDKGSGDNITIIVVFIRPLEELIAKGRQQAAGLESPDITGISSTSNYVFMSSRDSLEPSRDTSDFISPNVSFGNQDGGGVMFSPDPFANIQSPGAGFNFSSEEFNNQIGDQRLSGESQDRISEEHMQEILKQQSIDKVDDLFKMLDREDCSPSPEGDDARPLEEILAAARLQPQEEVDGVVDDDDSSDDEVLDFGACDQLNNGSAAGNIQLEEILKLDEKSLTEEQEETDTFSEEAVVFGYQEPQMDPCEQVTVKETGPEEYSTIVPPVQEMPSQQQPVMELVDPMVCSMVKEEQEQEVDVKTNGAINGIHHVNGDGGADSVSFDAKDDVGFMLKTPGETGEEELAEFSPGQEQETSVDTGESVGATASPAASLGIPNVKVTPATPVKERSPAPQERKAAEKDTKPEVDGARGDTTGSTTSSAASPKKSSSGGARPKVGVKAPVTKQVNPPVKAGPAAKTTARTTTGRPAAAAPTTRPTTTATTTGSRAGSAPLASRSKVTEDTKSTKSGSTTGSERNSRSGIADRSTPKKPTTAARTLERKPAPPKPDERTKKPGMTRTKPEPSKDTNPAASRRPTSGINKTPSNMSGQTSSASSTSSSRSRPALSASRPTTATTRVKPEEKKTGTVPRTAPVSRTTAATATARTATSSATSRLTGASSRTSSSTMPRTTASATTSRAAKTTSPVKPTAAASRVAAARAAAMAKPSGKMTKIKNTAGSKKEEEKKPTTSEVTAAPAVDGSVTTNGNGGVGGVDPNDVREDPAENDIQNKVNGLSDVNQSEC